MIILSIVSYVESRADDTRDAREIVYHSVNAANPRRLKRATTSAAWPCPDFHHHRAVGFELRATRRSMRCEEVEAIAPPFSAMRGSEANFGLEGREFGLGR